MKKSQSAGKSGSEEQHGEKSVEFTLGRQQQKQEKYNNMKFTKGQFVEFEGKTFWIKDALTYLGLYQIEDGWGKIQYSNGKEFVALTTSSGIIKFRLQAIVNNCKYMKKKSKKSENSLDFTSQKMV